MHSGAGTRCPGQKGRWHVHLYTRTRYHSPSDPLSFPSSTFHPTLHLSRLNSRPCINYLVMPRVPRLARNLCDLFRPRSHPPRCHTAIIYPPPSLPLRCSHHRGFLRCFFEFPGNEPIKSSVIANYNETNYLFQLAKDKRNMQSRWHIRRLWAKGILPSPLIFLFTNLI